MSVKFLAENHSYESTTDEKIDWTSVTTFIGNFKSYFDAPSVAQKCSKNKKSKWFGMTQEEILNAWSSEAKRSTDLGTWYHNQRENDLLQFQTIQRSGKDLPVVAPKYENGVKFAPDQKLTDGIYPEHFVYLKSAGLCGQSDYVEVVNGVVNIIDYKTNKEIKEKGYTSWDGKVSRLSGPLSHIDDCNLMHYNLQLSLYMFIILKHNPKLKPGKLIIHHISFEEQDRDKFDNPVYKVDQFGDFIIKEVKQIEMPYLKADCINLINWMKDNKDKIKKKNH